VPIIDVTTHTTDFTLAITTHFGTLTLRAPARAMDWAIEKYLPASPADLRRVARTFVDWPEIDEIREVSALLVILATASWCRDD
jgi:hypothetical protein